MHNAFMPVLHCSVEDAVIVVVDIQSTFMEVIHERERVLRRSRYLAQVAQVLDIPVLATEQNPTRLGELEDSLLPFVSRPISKMSFSCWGSAEFREGIEGSGRSSIVLVGVETHICVALTALDLVNAGYNVFVCPDATSSRTVEMHKLGMERMRDSGVLPSHTDTLVYEWLGSAEHPKFKEVLKLVKEA